MDVRVMPLPPTQLRGTPHAIAVDAAELLQACKDRASEGGFRRVQKARHGTGVTEAIGMEGGQRHSSVATLSCSDDRVATGSQALVGGQPVRQLAGQESIPLLAAVLLPVGVHAVCAAGGSDYRDALAGQ